MCDIQRLKNSRTVSSGVMHFKHPFLSGIFRLSQLFSTIYVISIMTLWKCVKKSQKKILNVFFSYILQKFSSIHRVTYVEVPQRELNRTQYSHRCIAIIQHVSIVNVWIDKLFNTIFLVYIIINGHRSPEFLRNI